MAIKTIIILEEPENIRLRDTNPGEYVSRPLLWPKYREKTNEKRFRAKNKFTMRARKLF